MDRGFLPERPGRAEQPWVTVVDPGMLGHWVPRVKVEGNTQPLDLRPERTVSRQVVVGGGCGVPDLAEPVDQCAAKAEFVHAAAEFASGFVRILQRQRRQ